MTVLCGACNAENRDAAKFCKGCGGKIAQAWAQATSAAASAGEAMGLLGAAAVAVPGPRAPAPAAVVADPVFLAPSPLRPRIGNGRWVAALGLGVVLLVALAAWWGQRNRSLPIPEPAPPAASEASLAPAVVAPPIVISEKFDPQPAAAEQAPTAPAAPKPRKAPTKKQPPPPAPVLEAAAPAPPPPAPEPVRVPSPQESCAGRNFIAYAQCMAAQCARPEVASHAQCAAVRRQQRLEEEKRNPIAN